MSLTGLILVCGLATYGTRVSGHLILSRFGRVNHRLEAALDAVPVAVLTAIVVPAFVENGWAEAVAMTAAAVAGFALPLPLVVVVGLGVLMVLRSVGF